MGRSASVFSIVVLVTLLLTLSFRAEARALFVFGDSLVDNGNNNYRATTARADYYPYGIDYPTHHPTGRFSNGYTVPDLISLQMGLEPTMPYSSPDLTGDRLLVGANFASAGIGILNDTGLQFLDTIKMYDQLEYLEEYKQRVSEIIGDEQTESLINRALFLFNVGSNDILNNYYQYPITPRSLQFALPEYLQYLLSEYKKILKRVYELGARRVLVTGVGPLGCVPYRIATRGINGKCVPEFTRAAELFNPQLFEMVEEVNREIGSQVFGGIDVMRMLMEVINDPQAYGFVTTKEACCGQGPYNGIGRCTFLSNLCPNRDIYVFWDLFHPTEKANKIMVQQIMSGTTDYMHPMNLSTILALDART